MYKFGVYRVGILILQSHKAIYRIMQDLGLGIVTHSSLTDGHFPALRFLSGRLRGNKENIITYKLCLYLVV